MYTYKHTRVQCSPYTRVYISCIQAYTCTLNKCTEFLTRVIEIYNDNIILSSYVFI